jgi:hypothetical protein
MRWVVRRAAKQAQAQAQAPRLRRDADGRVACLHDEDPRPQTRIPQLYRKQPSPRPHLLARSFSEPCANNTAVQSASAFSLH